MSQLHYIIPLRETIIDNDWSVIKDFDTDLPHKEMIKEEILKDWNKSNIFNYMSDKFKEKVHSMSMDVKENKDKRLEAIIHVNTNPGIQMRQALKSMITEELDGQMSDGWGEGFFGYNNIMTAEDGTKFIVE